MIGAVAYPELVPYTFHTGLQTMAEYCTLLAYIDLPRLAMSACFKLRSFTTLPLMCMPGLAYIWLIMDSISQAMLPITSMAALPFCLLVHLCRGAHWLTNITAQKRVQMILPPKIIYVRWCIGRRRRSAYCGKTQCFPNCIVSNVKSHGPDTAQAPVVSNTGHKAHHAHATCIRSEAPKSCPSHAPPQHSKGADTCVRAEPDSGVALCEQVARTLDLEESLPEGVQLPDRADIRHQPQRCQPRRKANQPKRHCRTAWLYRRTPPINASFKLWLLTRQTACHLTLNSEACESLTWAAQEDAGKMDSYVVVGAADIPDFAPHQDLAVSNKYLNPLPTGQTVLTGPATAQVQLLSAPFRDDASRSGMPYPSM